MSRKQCLMSICFPLTKTQLYVTITTSKCLTISRSTKLSLYFLIFDTGISGMEEYTVSLRTFTEREHRRTILADIYTIYADHKDNITAHEFVAKMKLFLDKLVEHNKMIKYRITRMKLGFRSMDLPEFRIDMEFDNMQKLDDAMTITIADKDVDKVHVGFNQYVDVDTIQHFLYRDFPDNIEQTKPKVQEEKQYTTEELIKATKSIDPDIWK